MPPKKTTPYQFKKGLTYVKKVRILMIIKFIKNVEIKIYMLN